LADRPPDRLLPMQATASDAAGAGSRTPDPSHGGAQRQVVERVRPTGTAARCGCALMTNATGKPDYRVRRPTDKPARAGVHAGNAATVEFLQLLGRAARQFHTYPAGSPLCTE